jgi:hypothetical protein
MNMEAIGEQVLKALEADQAQVDLDKSTWASMEWRWEGID